MTNQNATGGNWFNSTGVWGLITVLVTLAVAAWSIYSAQQRKSVSYYHISSSVFNTPNEFLELYFKGTPVKDVYISDVTIVNDGKQTVRASENARGIRVILGSSCRALSFTTTSSTPSSALRDFNQSLKLEKGELVFLPSVFNAGDRTTIRLLISECAQPITEIVARIEGVSNLRRASSFEDLNGTNSSLFVAGIMLFLLLVILGAIIDHSRRKQGLPSALKEGLLLLLPAIIIPLIVVFAVAGGAKK